MNPAHVCNSGNLVQEASRSGFAILLSPDLDPGEGRLGEIVIANLGVLPAVLRLSELNASNGTAPRRVALAIDEIDGPGRRRIFLGDIGGVPADGLDLGRFEPGEARTYRFTALLRKSSAGAERKSVTAAYEWTASPAPVLSPQP
jgi:hypothetical protein